MGHEFLFARLDWQRHRGGCGRGTNRPRRICRRKPRGPKRAITTKLFMCLAIPGKLIQVERDRAGVRMGKANFGGVTKEVCLEYTPEAGLGDYVLVHVGLAISKVDQAEAARTFQALKDLEQLGELETPE